MMKKLTAPLFIFLTLVLAVSMTVTSNAANTEYRHMIVDSFAEGAGSGSEVSAMPEDVVQKIINNQETDWRRLERVAIHT